jgi:hypothetical protein
MACKDLGRGAPSGSTSTAWRPVNLVSRCAGKSNDSKVCRWAGRTYVGGRRQPLLMSRTWWQLQSLVMYEGFKGEYLSRAHVLVSPALVVIIRDSLLLLLLLLCWVAGYRGGRGVVQKFFGGFGDPFCYPTIGWLPGKGVANGTLHCGLLKDCLKEFDPTTTRTS